MQTKTRKVLPKTASEINNGDLYLQRVRCGKPSCRCAGGETHTAYYFFTRRRGKLVKFYVRKTEVEAFTRIATEAAFDRAQKRLAEKESKRLLRQLREIVLEAEALTNLYKENLTDEPS